MLQWQPLNDRRMQQCLPRILMACINIGLSMFQMLIDPCILKRMQHLIGSPHTSCTGGMVRMWSCMNPSEPEGIGNCLPFSSRWAIDMSSSECYSCTQDSKVQSACAWPKSAAKKAQRRLMRISRPNLMVLYCVCCMIIAQKVVEYPLNSDVHAA